MKIKKIFVPIFKTKCISEPSAIKECLNLFSDRMIPYLEIKKNTKGYERCYRHLNKITHFEQLNRNENVSLKDSIEAVINKNDPFIIPSIYITSNDDFDDNENDIKKFINTLHKKDMPISIRIDAGIDDNVLNLLFLNLYNNDFLFVDINENEYKSSLLFLKKIHASSIRCKVIVISNERPINIQNSSLEENGYNNLFNTTVISSILNEKKFLEDGFASYCSAKNDTYEGEHPVNKSYATFLIYDYSNNSFYSFRTHTSKVSPNNFYELKEILKHPSNHNIINGLFNNTSISNKKLNNYLNGNKPGNASTLITISIIHYIEGIYLLMK